MTTGKIKKVTSSDDADLYAVRDNWRETGFGVKVGVHSRVMIDGRASLAMKLIERWGMIVGDADGEDAAGRQKLRLMTPDELTRRACDCAESAYKEIAARGWTVAIPSMEDLQSAIQSQEDSNE